MRNKIRQKTVEIVVGVKSSGFDCDRGGGGGQRWGILLENLRQELFTGTLMQGNLIFAINQSEVRILD